MMQSSKQRPPSISLRSKFARPYSATQATSGERVLMSKEQNPDPGIESTRRKSDRIYKIRNGHDVKFQSPSSMLADNFAASLDQYRENILGQMTKDIASINTQLNANLDELSLDINTHFEQLMAVEETLQRPFSTETLTVQVRQDVNGSEIQEEILLETRINEFRRVRQDKQNILTELWDEWEAIQMEIIILSAEVCGSGAISLSQDQQDNMKEGQQEQFDTALVNGQKRHDQTTDDLSRLYQDLQDLEESFSQITSQTKHAVVEMQQQYNVQRNKLFKGLHRHIELLASL